ncbi:MAG: CRISPR system precrRNA processing endoribonuclease RAMP protein Cas6 [Anaerolineales bacterium]|nr:CRISPR system precrRNA processing endoribonuclease RAMP protein Cas6 [Anaerolineales bacterium]
MGRAQRRGQPDLALAHRIICFSEAEPAGGVGRLQYRLLDDRTPQNAAHFDRLLHLAFYAGIGYKTTHGLGQVRLLTPE